MHARLWALGIHVLPARDAPQLIGCPMVPMPMLPRGEAPPYTFLDREGMYHRLSWDCRAQMHHRRVYPLVPRWNYRYNLRQVSNPNFAQVSPKILRTNIFSLNSST